MAPPHCHAPHRGCEQRGHDRSGRRGESRLCRAVAPDRLDPLCVQQPHAEEPDGEEQSREVGGDHERQLEEREIEERVRHGAAALHEQCQQQHACRERDDRAVVDVAPHAALGDREGHECHTGEPERSADEVDVLGCVRVLALVQQLAPDKKCEETEGNVDKEQRTPVEPVNENPAGRGPDRCGQAADCSPHADRDRALLGGELGQHQCERCRCQLCTADGLHQTRQHQGQGVRCESAQHRADAEQGESAHERSLAAVHVGEATGGQQTGGIGDAVTGEHPGHQRGVAEVLCDRALGNHDNARVERDQEGGDCGEAEDLVGAGEPRGGCVGHVCPPVEQVNITKRGATRPCRT